MDTFWNDAQHCSPRAAGCYPVMRDGGAFAVMRYDPATGWPDPTIRYWREPLSTPSVQ